MELVPTRTKVLACATVIEEMLPLLPPGMAYETLDFGLHIRPDTLRQTLQQAIDATPPQIETTILGYGLCSQAVAGLHARCTLVVPRVDDCIALFLGSDAAYRQQLRAEPGTYYLTKGWIEVGDSPFTEHDRLVEHYGRDKAEWLTGQILKHYTRLALINTGQAGMDRYRAYARQTAARFGLRYEEVPGSTGFLRRMLYGPWDGDFVIARPGHTISFGDFR